MAHEETDISIHDEERSLPAGASIDAPHHDLTGRRPLLPRDDPFYEPVDGLGDLAPGTILQSRDVGLAFLGVIPQRINAVQLSYRTTDMNGEPMAAVTTVLSPSSRAPGEVYPIVSYQCAIDAITGRCFPSYALRRGSKALGALPQLEFLLIAALLAEGWAVSIPDHEGPRGLWGLPREPGYCVLDGIRASMNYPPLNVGRSAPVGLWGYSGGGLASAWAAEMYADYAPELDVVGAVLGSPVGDLGKTYERLNGSFFSGLPALVVGALGHVYPDLRRVIETHATPAGKKSLARLQKMTTVEAVMRFMFTDMDSMLDRPLDEILALPEVREVFDSIRLGRATPAMPVLIVQAVNDRIMSVDDIDELARVYSEGGASVTYHRDRFSEHMLLHPMSAPMALRWLQDRFDGRPVRENRLRTTWPTLLNPSTYRGMARLVGISAKVVGGRAIARAPLSEFDR